MRSISDIDASYLAGFMDGEGCISAGKKPSNGSCQTEFFLTVSYTNTNREVLEWIQLVTGTGEIHCKGNRKANWKKTFTWKVTSSNIRPFLERILPFLRIKDEQVKVMLEFLETYETRSQRDPLTWQVLQQREFLYQHLAELNKRGV